MGTLAALDPLLGLLAGALVARLAKNELKQGKYYFILLQHALLASIAGVLLWQSKIAALAIGLLLFIIFWKTKFANPLELTPLLAVPAALAQSTHSPIFLYFIPTGTLHWKETAKLTGIALVYAVIVVISSA